MDLELENYVDIVVENQEYRSGIFGKYWEIPTSVNIWDQSKCTGRSEIKLFQLSKSSAEVKTEKSNVIKNSFSYRITFPIKSG